MKEEGIIIQALKGKELLSSGSEFTKLRLAVYREYPYLYEGDSLFEESYLSLIANSSDAMLIIAKVGNQVVGAASGLPLDGVQKEIREVFQKSKIEIRDYYHYAMLLY